MKRLAILIILICTASQLSAQSVDSLNIVDTLNNRIYNLDEVVVTAPVISQNKYGRIRWSISVISDSFFHG